MIGFQFQSFKCAAPIHVNTPDPVAMLAVIHHKDDKNLFNEIAKTLKTMNKQEYEDSRMVLQFSLEHIVEQFLDIYTNINANLVKSGIEAVFKAKLNMIDQDIKSFLKSNKNKVSLNDVKSMISLITLYSEGVELLEDFSKYDASLEKLLLECKETKKENLKNIFKKQDAIKILIPKYEIVTESMIDEDASKIKNDSIKISYSSIQYRSISRLETTAGSRNILWRTTQNDELRNEYYDKNYLQRLTDSEILYFQEKLPLIYEQYANIFTFSFTNIIKLMCASSILRAGHISENVSRKFDEDKKNDKVYYLNESDNLFKAVNKFENIFEKISGNYSKKITLYFDNKIEKNIAKLEGYDQSVIFYVVPEQTYACLISNEDLKNGKILKFEEALKKSKGSSFHGMAQFLTEIQDEFVQKYYFGNQDNLLKIEDER